MIKAECNNCGKSIKIYPSDIKVCNHHFCSRKCKSEYQINQQIKVKCETCGKAIKRIPYKIKKHKYHFCSRKCRSEFFKDKNNPAWKGGKVEVKCEICEKIFLAYTSANQRFCSEKCMLNALHKQTYKQIKIKCKQCGKIFNRTPSHIKRRPNPFCSRECFKSFTNKIDVKCDFCGKKIKKSPSKIKKHKYHFCSKKCVDNFKKKYYRRENHWNWQNGKSFEPYGVEFNSKLREQIRSRDNFRCQECFRHQDELRTKTNRPYKLNIHHIDYNKKNNNSNNLISLCRVCHIKANFNRDDWTQYYQEKIGDKEKEILYTINNNISIHE